MVSKKTAWTAATVVAMVGLVELSAWSQQTGKSSSFEVNQAKEIAALIERGQLNLSDATEIAEKHLRGTALQARCAMEPASSEHMKQDGSREAQDEKGRSQLRLMYDVSCFAKDKVVTVRVDGATKTVVEDRQRP